MDTASQERRRLTYRNEKLRAVSAGVFETAGQTFLLLVAVKHFDAGATAKAAIAASGSLGLLLTIGTVFVVSSSGWRPSQAAAGLALISASSMGIAAAFPYLPIYVVCCVVALACVNMGVPLFTQIYQDNYPENERGKLFSRTVMIRVGVAVMFSYAAGEALSGNIGRFRWLLAIYALAFAGSAFGIARCPSEPLTRAGGTHPFHAFRYVRDDRVFRWTLICWMLLGFANLMMQPMRVEYLASPRYGLELTPARVALLVGVIPNIARLVMSPIWGWFFDRMNFFVLRVTLNIGFAISILAFFTSNNVVGLIGGAVVFGIAMAGGDLAWSLWVTKFAPPERVAEYMSVHTFFTGLRGLIAPFVGFYLVGVLSVGVLGCISAGIIVLASLILAREIKLGKSPDPGTALLKEAAD